MLVLSAAERRGALVVLLLLAIGAGYDLWRALRPRALAAALGLSNEMARGFEVAWAWWVFLRVAEKPAEHFAVISDFNTMLSGDGDQILQPSDVEAFVGDVPTVAGVSTKKWKMILVLGFVVAGGVVVWKLLPRHAPMRLREALRGARR